MKNRRSVIKLFLLCWMMVLMALMAFASARGSLLLSPQEAPKKNKDAYVTYFSSRSLYFYVMGSYHVFDPPGENFYELGPDSAGTFAPIFGAGYRLVNIGERFFLNLEVDYAPGIYDFGAYARDQEIRAWTILLDAEWNFKRRSPFFVTFGIGIGIFDMRNLGYTDDYGEYIPTGNDTEAGVTVKFGLKLPISNNFTLRTEFRWNGKSYGDYCYWDDWYDYCGDTETDFLSSAICLGLEFHFGSRHKRR